MQKECNMRILVANDDGINSPGIFALAEALWEDGNLINIVAPQTERSGAGHSMTMFAPVEIFDAVLPGLKHIPSFAISGTPVDCVKLGAGTLFERPDLVMTGINTGTNLGCDIYGSGTVNAAAAAIEKGLPAIAVSIAANHPVHLETATAVALWALHDVLKKLPGIPPPLLNINVPDLPKNEVKGIKITPIARANPDYQFMEYISPRKRRWFWDAAGPLNEFEETEDVDERWLREGYVTLTPLKFDINDWNTLTLLKESGLACL